MITSTQAITMKTHSPIMFSVRESCYRCKRAVYPTDKMGPLKDGTFFHHGCFKCYICGTRLTLKSYCNNRNNTEDQEVYCSSHVPQANPHDPVPHRSNLLSPPQTNGHATVITNGDHGNTNGTNGIGVGDIHIQHALRASELQKPYPKQKFGGANYQLDYDTQTRLELVHREQEDLLYEKFHEKRQEHEHHFEEETKEEWEKALKEITRKYDHSSSQGAKARDHMIKHLTIKREKQRETMMMKLREKERSMTADLVEKQSTEMIDLFRQARKELTETAVSSSDEMLNGQSGYPSTPPPPFPPVGRKRDIYNDPRIFETVDQIAISVAQAEQRSFTDLVSALTTNGKSDVEKARAIYRWITVKNLNLMDFDNRLDPNSPMGILRGIKFGTESYHVLFKRLCSYAGLHCVVIKGFSKSAGYQPGMQFDDNRFRNTWNAVFLSGSWRFVQCNWGARHLVNAKDSGSGSNQRYAGRSDNLRYEYDDHYFMTDPEEFIYEFYSHQEEWQLLKRPISVREFASLPFVRSLFFRYGLSFADPNLSACVYADKSGAATVAIQMSSEAMETLIFHYNLRFYDSDQNDHNGINLKRFVMQSVVGHSVVFRVHTPCKGEFLLDVFANAISAGDYLTGQPMKFKSVCKFKVVCDHLNVIMVPLPECASGEWGPAKAYRLFGLIPVSHEDAIINSGIELEIRFRMQRPLAEFVASLHKNLAEERRMGRAVSHQIRGDVVIFTVRFPDEGQYGLDIYTRERRASPDSGSSKGSDKQLLTHCCKYLINARI